MNNPHEILFEPLQIGARHIPNRLVMAPMTREFSPHGVPGPDVAAYYRRRAEGGLGLIITEGTFIDHPPALSKRDAPRFYGADALNGWSRVVQEVHAAGGLIFPQLWHPGLTRRKRAARAWEDEVEDLTGKASPSGYVLPGEKVSEGLSVAEIELVIRAFADAAATAERLSFDGIELHGAHGYLIDQFFWPALNLRDDQYGGDLMGRLRFAVELVQACRASVRKDFPICFRFSQWKEQEYAARLAATPQELEKFLLPLAAAGVDIFHASQRRYWLPEFEGSDLNLAGWAKRITGKLSITVGSVGLSTDMHASMVSEDTPAVRIDKLLEMMTRGDFDLVAVGRGVLADPDWPLKLRRGAFDEIKPFNYSNLETL